MIVDNFLDDFESLREHCDTVDYSGMVNPVDGVEYPGISTDIPKPVQSEIKQKLTEYFPNFRDELMFMRLSTEGVKAPHYAHTDTVMGDFSLMLYLNRYEHCKGGTALLTHKKTGMNVDPASDLELEVWEKDTNNVEAWEPYSVAYMAPNRAYIFPANLMHGALPYGGFGDSAENGRLVLTCFFKA